MSTKGEAMKGNGAKVQRHRAPSGNGDSDSFAAFCPRCGWKGAHHSNRTIEGRELAKRDAERHAC